MNKGIVYIAPAGAKNKRASVFREVISLCPEGDYSSVYYVTPSVFGLEEAKRRFFSFIRTDQKENIYIPFQSFTLKGLCAKFYQIHKTEKIVSGRLETLILCDILDERNIGYAGLLSDLLARIRHYVPDSDLPRIKDDLKSLIFEEKPLKQAVRAIQVLERYNIALEQRGLIDSVSAVKNSIPLIQQHVSPAVLVLDGFFDPTPLELDAIRIIIEKSENVFAVVEETSEFVKFFESFKGGIQKKRLKPSVLREAGRYYTYSSMEDEVEGIARGAKGLITEGIKPHHITVSFPVLSKYLPMLKRIFRKHGVPVDPAEVDLSVSKPFVAVEEMISSVEDDYPRIDFLSFLTSAHFPGIPEIVRQRAVSLSARAGIVKGKKAWLSIRETLLDTSEETISGGENSVLDEFQKQIKQVITTLERLKHENGLLFFIEEMEKIFNKFGFYDSPGSSDDISADVEVIMSEMKHFALLFSLDNISFSDSAYYFRQMFRGLKGSDRNTGGVRVVPFELAAGLEPEVLFFGGMTENDLPSRPSIDPILPEKVKKSLGLPYLEYYLNRQKRHFDRLINGACSDPYLSCPGADGDKIFLPSPFLDWEQSLSPPVQNIPSEEDILLREGALKHRDFSDVLWGGELPADKRIGRVLAKRFGPKAFFRVTDIDAYRKCPMRFYIERFLGLEMAKTPEFEVESRLWGKLAHRTMENLFREGDVEPDEMAGKLLKGLDTSLKEFPVGGFWAGVAKEIFLKLLPALKEQETEIRSQGFTPFMTEKALKTEVKPLRLKGKIDRVDRKRGKMDERGRTKDEGKDQVRLLDYKTGSADRDSLQLPLYISMWNREHNEPVDRAGFYSLKDGKVDWYPKRAGMEEFLNNSLRLAEELVEKIRKGLFAPAPFKGAECRFCSHSSLCKGTK